MNSQTHCSWMSLTSSKENFSVVHGQYETDFFVLTHGLIPLTAPTSARLACDTALWGYEQIRRRKYYWLDKKKLMTRIMRTTNIALFQKAKEPKFSQGVLTEGVFCMVGTRVAWVSCFGNASVYEVRTNKERRIIGSGNEYYTYTDRPLGMKRYEWFSDIASIPFEQNDVLLLTVGDVASIPIELIDQIQHMYLYAPLEFEEACSTLLHKEIPSSTWGITILTK